MIKKDVGCRKAFEIMKMPYEQRIRNYEREKNELFYELAALPAAEIAKRHEELREKWRV